MASKPNFKFKEYSEYDGNTLYKQNNYEGDPKFNHPVGIYDKPEVFELPKEFIRELVEYNRIDGDAQIKEYENLIKRDIYVLGKTLIHIDRPYVQGGMNNLNNFA